MPALRTACLAVGPRRRARPALLIVVAVLALAAGPVAPHRIHAQSDDDYTEIDDLFAIPDDDGDDDGRDGDDRADGAPGTDTDDLFDTPDDTVTDDDGSADDRERDNDSDDEESADETVVTDVVDIGGLTTSPTSVTGSVKASAGVNFGYNEWPGSDAAEERTWRDLLQVAAGYSMSTSVTVDGRPQPYLRYRASLSSSLSTSSLTMSTPAFTEIFVDYTIRDTVFLRAGKFGMGWGRARLFSSPGNLVSRVGSGAAIRGSTAVGLGSVTGVLYTTPTWIKAYDHREGDPRSFAGAAQLEQTAGIFTFELAGHYQHDEDPLAAATVTMNIGDLTLAGEERYRLTTDNAGIYGADALVVESVANFFWENRNRRWTFWGEYNHNARRRDDEIGDDGVRRDGRHLVGLAMKAPSLGGGGWRPQLTWRHAVGDLSGQVIAGTSGTIAPNLTLSFGMPVFYGKPGSYYRGIAETRVISDVDTESTDTTLTEEEEDLLRISGQDVISLTFGLSISFSF
ncbi:MAG: hypothetical protein ACOCYQ_01165 [Alkalispirochaeta sp.]